MLRFLLQTHRDKALGVKSEVDGLLSGFPPMEDTLTNLDDRLQDSMNNTHRLINNLSKVGSKDLSKGRWYSPIQTSGIELSGSLYTGQQPAGPSREGSGQYSCFDRAYETSTG